MKRKKLSLHVNREVVTLPQPAQVTTHKRGLFEDPHAFDGTMIVNIYSADDKRLGRWEAAGGVTDTEFMDAMWALLERYDSPIPRLEVQK